MKVLVTGGTGFVGRFIVEELLGTGHTVAVAGRSRPPVDFFSKPVEFRPLDLDPDRHDPALLAGIDGLVHTAFHHVAGRYRGGEGADPDGFRRLNRDGSVRLFETAKAAGAGRCLFLSSRAIYGRRSPGLVLTEETEPRPDTLYGEVKFEAERALAALASDGFMTASLRVTGVYGPPPAGARHKWEDLFADWLAGRPVEPRCGTEVHGADVARAVRLMLEKADLPNGEVFNVSDILVDRRDILALVAEEAHGARALPSAADASSYNTMATGKLRKTGWHPGGRSLFESAVRELARAFLTKY